MNLFQKIRLILTIISAKITIKICRLTRNGGTTLPGRVAARLYPDILKIITAKYTTIMVTGTNGKTTTTRIIGEILRQNNVNYITNKSGANLVGGVITTFIQNVSLLGTSKASTALIEIDEAAFNNISNYIEPDILVVTNFFRDQLDRYGELYTTLNGVKSGISRAPGTKLLLNADDSLCASIGKQIENEVYYYGMAADAVPENIENINTDAAFCIYCKNRYSYSYRTYGHLGGFKCSECGYERPEAFVSCASINELTSTYSHITVSTGMSEDILTFDARINLPGLYNIYNSLAAIACGSILQLSVPGMVKALESFECGFGRMETIDAGGRYIKVILVKNPTGFNQVINYLLTVEKNIHIAFALNDKLADGTDISWIWDVDFEKLSNIRHLTESLYASGTRAEDMAVRLKYCGVDIDKIKIIKDYDRLIDEALQILPEGHSLFLLPTYTAMMDIRKIMENKFSLKEFWK